MTSYDPYPEKLPSIAMLNHQGNNHDHNHQDVAFSNFASNSDLYASNNPNTTTNDMSLDLYNQQHSSPPLTPAVSPSNMMDPAQFKRKYSIDFGSFGFNAHSALVHDQDDYRRSSCSAMSVDDSTQPQPPLHQQLRHPLQQQMIHQHHEQQQQPNYYYHNRIDHQSTHHDNSSYLIGDSSSLSGNIVNASSTTHDSMNINNNTTITTTKFGKRARLGQYYQQGPNAAHKHVCKYSECGWSFKRYEHLKRHMLVHTGERAHICTFPGCGKSFSRSDNFHAHYRTHTKKQQSGSSRRNSKIDGGSPLTGDVYMPMTASPSSSSTSSQQDLGNGYTSSQPFDFNSNKSFEMTYQDVYEQQSFTNEVQDQYSSMDSPQPYMRMGISSHGGVSSLLNHDESPSMFISNVMTPIYDMQSAYTEFHSTTHSNASPTLSSPISSPTTLSGPGSTKKQRKYRASLSHSASNSVADSAGIMQQKSHVCPMAQCQRRFKRLEHLKRHMRIHTLERPFACTFPQCHKHFSRSDNLSQHMKTHQHRPGQDKRRKSSITNTIGTSSSASSSSSVSPRSVMDDFASTNPPHCSYSTTGVATSTLPSWDLPESVGC